MDDASTLLAQVAAGPGPVSPAVYDTARLASLVPGLPGHERRISYLMRSQSADGSWGEADGYAVVPTLSATEALLARLRSGEDRVAGAAAAGVRWLAARPAGAPVPDTIAVELIVPALVRDINDHLAALPAYEGTRVGLPRGFDGAALEVLRQPGRSLPSKLWASLEILGPAARRAHGITPADGAVAGSPAATAAWLGDEASAEEPAAQYLLRIQDSDGAVPGVTPITFFERAWVLASLAGQATAPSAILDSLERALGEHGAPAAPGIPPDADDTAAVLHALALHGRPRSPGCLLSYQADSYFKCFPGERNPSISTNAHVLEALGGHPGFTSEAAMVARWLLGQQDADGSWLDKWHASPYYATACCVLALAARGGPAARPALKSAAAWVLATQRRDGSWGRWRGTIEETAYAVQVLRTAGGQHSAEAVARGQEYLREHDDPAKYPPLWHAKDLYAPVTVIRAARLAALA